MTDKQMCGVKGTVLPVAGRVRENSMEKSLLSVPQKRRTADSLRIRRQAFMFCQPRHKGGDLESWELNGSSAQEG